MKRGNELHVGQWLLKGAMAFVLACFVGIMCFSTVSSAAEQGKVTATSVNIRKEASSTSEAVGNAPNGKVVTINGTVQGSDGYTWYQVVVDNVSGYIRSDLVEKSTAGGSTTETPAEVSKVNPISATVKGGNSVRIRSNASTTSQIVTTASTGFALTVTGSANGSDGKVWYQVSFTSNGADVEGFIRSDYVELSGELTPFTEQQPETAPETQTPEQQPETAPEAPVVTKPYEVVEQEGLWYLVITETNEGYVIQDIFDKMASNATEYGKLEKKVKSQKVGIVILVILLVAAVALAAILFLRMKDIVDSRFIKEIERDTLRGRETQRAGNQRVMHTVGAEKNGRPQGSRPAGAPQGSRPAGAPQGNRPAGAPQGSRPAGAPQGNRPAGAPQGNRPAGAPQGNRPAGAPQGNRPAGAPQGNRPAGAPQGNRPAGAPQAQKPVQGGAKPENKQGNSQPGWQSKNFMADDDEFEFEFLNYDGEEEKK